MYRKALFVLMVLAVGLVAQSPSQLIAQTALGSIEGLITDASRALVPGAEVTLTETQTGITRTVPTNSEGHYNFADVQAGTYTVTVKMSGFKTVVSEPFLLEPTRTKMFDAQLQVGDTATKVEVTAVAPTINTEDGALSTSTSREEILNLPLNSRSVTDFRPLAASNYEYGSIGGQRSSFGYYNLDGVSAMAPAWGAWSGPAMSEYPLEALDEFKIASNNVSAEFADVANLSIATRSGTNALHGSLYFIETNNAFDARNFFAATKPKGPQEHDLGGSFGGPVYIPHVYDGRNKTFFYTTYERTIYPAAGSGNMWATEPTAAMREGDFSQLLPANNSNPVIITDPTTGQPFPGNIIPKNRLSAVSQAMASSQFMPLPNFGGANSLFLNYNVIVPNGTYNYKFVQRVDHQLRTNDTVSFRLLHVHNLENAYDQPSPVWYHYQYRNVNNVLLSETHTFSPAVVNEFRMGLQRDYSLLDGKHNGSQILGDWGITGINLTSKTALTGAPSVSFANFASLGETTGYFWAHTTLDFLDNLTWTKGKHMIKFGANAWRNRMNNSDGNNPFGSFSFNNTFATGYDFADFMLGLPFQTSRYTQSPNYYNRDTQLASYVQDDWRVTPRLTLNLGLRWEYMTAPVATNNMRYAFDPSNGDLVVPNAQALSLINPLFVPTTIVTASQVGFPGRSLVSTPTRDFGPRLGFAYRPFSDKTVIRGSYAIAYTAVYWPYLNAFDTGPFSSSEYFTNSLNSAGVAAFSFPNPFPSSPQIAGPESEQIDGMVTNPHTPYTQQWNLTVEHEFPGQIVAHVTYRGNRTLQLLYSRDINMPPPSDGTGEYNEGWYRYPNFYSVSYYSNGGSQFGNQLDIGIERKFKSSLTFQAGYAWARSLTDIMGGDVAGAIEDGYNRRRDWGPETDPIPNNKFTVSGVYELPFGTGKRFGGNLPHSVRQAFGNWQVSWIGVLQSGLYNTAEQCCFDTSNSRNWYTRPDAIGKWKLPNPTVNGWFNVGAFAVPGCPASDPVCANTTPVDVGRFGTAANNTIVGPGVKAMDFGLFKYFTIKEKGRLQFRVTATNLFNHPNFTNPDTTITDYNAGTISGTNWLVTSAGPRTIQIGLRYDF